ncbi:MAG: tetratricopeptide repeat protein [Planctomyces sp.]
MFRSLIPGFVCLLLPMLSGCSVGMALLQRNPAPSPLAAKKLVQVAEFHEVRGNYEAAAVAYQRALEMDPASEEIEERLAEVAQMQRVERRRQTEAAEPPETWSVASATRDRRVEEVLNRRQVVQAAAFEGAPRIRPLKVRPAPARRSSRAPVFDEEFEPAEVRSESDMIGKQTPLF